MILRLSVHDPGTGARYDVEISADPGTGVGSVLDALPLPVGGRRCFVDGRLLDPAATVGDSPLVHGTTISIGAPGPQPRAVVPGAVGALRVLDGHDAGLVSWLDPGGHVMGRDPQARVVLTCDEVSRNHAALTVSRDGAVTVEDLHSSNGTLVDDASLVGPAPLAAGAVLEAGTDRMEWVPLPRSPLPTTRSHDGRLDFDRAFAPTPAVGRTEVTLPSVPTRQTASRGAVWIPALLPVLIGGVLFVVMRNPILLVTCLLGPASVIGNQLVTRRQRGADDQRFEKEKGAALHTITTAVAAEEKIRRAQAPDRLDLTLAATGADRRVWPRNADSPDGLRLRVGTADEPASIDLRGERWAGFTEPTLRGVPLTVDLRAVGVLGVTGPAGPAADLARWLLVQLGVLRSPDDLRIVLITSGDRGDLAWAAWLPHVAAGEAGPVPCWVGNTEHTRASRIAELRDLITIRSAERRGSGNVGFAEDVVVVLDGALALRNLSGMKAILRDGPEAGVYVIAVDRHGMNECRAECQVDDTRAVRLTHRRGEQVAVGRCEGIDPADAELLARALAALRDRLSLGSAESAIPYPVRFLDLVGVGLPSADDVLALWADQPGPTTRVLLGADGDGPVTVDLAGQGPHTMLGGATGAGKSILLQTLVTSLLLANTPDELNLVLVDFKGGSAFLPFERCPHVVGLIRSTGETPADVFDQAAADRVLASVRAEVRRRESLLARYGGEIDEYWRARRDAPGLPALPRLVMIFDEFARVLETSPDFLRALVNVAAKGRSLGMHLVLATQSLQGKLSAELKNNIELRITLRQNEPADSVEVLGIPDAAAIPGRLRGRGMILCTKDETRTPRLFQSGYLGDPPPVGGARPAHIRIVDWVALGTARPEDRADHGGAATDQTLTVRAIEAAASRLGRPAPLRPLLPSLPADLTLDDLTARATVEPPATAIPYGLIDIPDAQAQPPAVLDLAGRDRLLVAGGPQQGRTTLARTLITSLAARFRPDEAQVYVIEHQPAGLAAYAGLPHCGAVIAGDEPDRIRRFVTWLHAEVARRQTARLGGGGGGGGGPATEGQREPWIVVVVDGWERFENRSDPTFQETSLLTTLRETIEAGPPLGVHVVPLGGQELFTSRVATLFTHRLLLPFGKEEVRRAQLPSGVASPPTVPGRAVDAATGTHVQICRPDVDADMLIGQVTARLTTTRLPAAGPARLPRPFPPLPTQLRVEDLRLPDPPPSDTWLPLGVGGLNLDVVGMDFFDAGPHVLLVSGPTRSGRTTAAATVIRGLRRIGVGVLVLAPPRSPLPTLVGDDDDGVRIVTGTTVQDTDLRATAEAFGDGRYAVVVDDCGQITLIPTQVNFADGPTLLQDIAGPGSLGRHALVLCGDAAPILTGQHRSLARVVSEIMTSGARLLLTPTVRGTAYDHGFKLEPDQFFAAPAGRGYLATARTTALVQLAR
ncbi:MULTISPECIES: FtsK/SpoIIIE domain-containing protein [unclassified Frankia]|uniref:FtsK/SpoIIIE domain-containing protein n=1 Tax=unclassified Frankia TaxID=2632575 RepID=UPI002AD4728C|nr:MULTISPECIES: FtsK/SpoIIIE domain-containing protein [unclassified Frankia]